jgi:signal transduction histidine kinase
MDGAGASTASAPWWASRRPAERGTYRFPELRLVERDSAVSVPRSRATRLAIALCLAAAYAVGAWVPFWYLSPTGGVAFFPPAGLTVATLILTPRRTWPLWLAAFGAAEIGVDLAHHQKMALTLGFALANTLEPFVGASLFRACLRRWDGYRARTVAFALCGAVVGPVVGAAVGATTTTTFPPPAHGWWATAATWWLGDALGVVVVGSAVLTWAYWSYYKHRASLASVPAIAALAAGTAGVVVITAVVWDVPAVFATLPLLVWAAFEGGPLAVTAVGIALAGATDWAALSGRAGRLFALASPTHDLTVLQAYLGVTLLTVLVLAAEVAERRQAQRERQESEIAAVGLAEAERQSLTQETHDLVGHGLTAVLLQLGAARQVVSSDPQLACELLASAEEIGRRACGDLESALRRLGHQPALEPARGIEGLADLVGALSKAGLRVTLDMQPERLAIPALVDWSAYRIAQEALTNVARHAPGAEATVTVRFRDGTLQLSVVDDGGPAGGTRSPKEGRGITGMRERAAALGGTLEAWPRKGRGFAVVATLPL